MRFFALVCVLLGGMGQGVVAPRLPELLAFSSQLTLDAGLSAALMYLGIFLSTFLYGKVADQGRIHWLLAPGLLGYAGVLVLLGFSSGQASLFTLRFCEGLALSAIFVAADFALGRLSAEKERGRWLSYYGVALSIGLVLGPLASLAAPRLAGFFGLSPRWAQAPLLPLGAVAIVALILATLAWRKKVPPAEPEVDEADLARRLDLRPLVAGAAHGFMEASLVAVFPALAVRELHIAPEVSLLLAIMSAAVFSVAWGSLADRVGARPVTLALIGILAIAPAALALATRTAATQTVAFSSCVLFGLIAGGLYPVGFSWLLESVSARRYGYASGAFARAYGAGSLVGPLVAGVACEAMGFRGLLLILSSAGVLAAAGITWAERRRGLQAAPTLLQP